MLTGNLDRSVGDPVWARTGAPIVATTTGGVRVARVGLDSSLRTVAENLVGGDLDRPLQRQPVQRRDSTVATPAATQRPPTSGSPMAASRAGWPTNRSLFAAKTLGNVEELTVTAFDGLPIRRPRNRSRRPASDPAKKYPLILEEIALAARSPAYGSFSTDDSSTPPPAACVVYANPAQLDQLRRAFANQIDKAYPGRDYDDLMSAVDAAIAKSFVDKDNLFVWRRFRRRR